MPGLQQTRNQLGHSKGELSEASQDRLTHLEQREQARLTKLDSQLSQVASKIVEIEKGFDTDFVQKYIAQQGKASFNDLLYQLTSHSPERGFRMLRNFASKLGVGDIHKALYGNMDTSHDFLVSRDNGKVDMDFTKYSIQVRRQELVDHVIETLNQSGLSYSEGGTAIQITDLDKSQMVEQMMNAWKVPENKKNDVNHALMVSMHADSELLSKATRNAIGVQMSSGVSGGLHDVVQLNPSSTIQVLTGGGFLDVPTNMTSEFQIKYAAEYNGRIYAMMANGCEGNLIIIENGNIGTSPEEATDVDIIIDGNQGDQEQQEGNPGNNPEIIIIDPEAGEEVIDVVPEVTEIIIETPIAPADVAIVNLPIDQGSPPPEHPTIIIISQDEIPTASNESENIVIDQPTATIGDDVITIYEETEGSPVMTVDSPNIKIENGKIEISPSQGTNPGSIISIEDIEINPGTGSVEIVVIDENNNSETLALPGAEIDMINQELHIQSPAIQGLIDQGKLPKDIVSFDGGVPTIVITSPDIQLQEDAINFQTTVGSDQVGINIQQPEIIVGPVDIAIEPDHTIIINPDQGAVTGTVTDPVAETAQQDEDHVMIPIIVVPSVPDTVLNPPVTIEPIPQQALSETLINQMITNGLVELRALEKMVPVEKLDGITHQDLFDVINDTKNRSSPRVDPYTSLPEYDASGNVLSFTGGIGDHTLRGKVIGKLLHGDIEGAQREFGSLDYSPYKHRHQVTPKINEKVLQRRTEPRVSFEAATINNKELMDQWAFPLDVRRSREKFQNQDPVLNNSMAVSGSPDYGKPENYAIISKTDMKIYLFTKDHTFVKRQPLVIGASYGDGINATGQGNDRHTPGGLYYSQGRSIKHGYGNPEHVGAGLLNRMEFHALTGNQVAMNNTRFNFVMHGLYDPDTRFSSLDEDIFNGDYVRNTRRMSNGCVNISRSPMNLGEVYNHLSQPGCKILITDEPPQHEIDAFYRMANFQPYDDIINGGTTSYIPTSSSAPILSSSLVIDDTSLAFKTYGSANKTRIAQAIQKLPIQQAQQLVPLLQDGSKTSVIAFQEAIGMDPTARNKAEEADGYFGDYTMNKLNDYIDSVV